MPRNLMGHLFRISAVTLLLVYSFGHVVDVRNHARGTQKESTCDSTLMILVLLSQQEFGFQPMGVDLANFDLGDLQPYFAELGATQGRITTTDAVVTDLIGSDSITGDDANCALLRAEVESSALQQLEANARY